MRIDLWSDLVCPEEVGLVSEKISHALAGDAFAEHVRADEAEAAFDRQGTSA